MLVLVPLNVPLTEALTPGAAADDGGGSDAGGMVADGVDGLDGLDGFDGVDGVDGLDDVPLPPPSAIPELPVPELPVPELPVPELPVGDPAIRAVPPVSDVPVPTCQPSRMIPADAAEAMMTARILTS